MSEHVVPLLVGGGERSVEGHRCGRVLTAAFAFA